MTTKPTEPLTQRQLEVLRAVHDLTELRGPTRRQLCEALGMTSTNAVTDALGILVRKGMLEILPLSSRGVMLTEAGWSEVEKREPAALDAARRGEP